jgi:hypothetical protein
MKWIIATWLLAIIAVLGMGVYLVQKDYDDDQRDGR